VQNGKLILPGYNSHLWERKFPANGVITILAQRKIPVIHLLQMASFSVLFMEFPTTGRRVPGSRHRGARAVGPPDAQVAVGGNRKKLKKVVAF